MARRTSDDPAPKDVLTVDRAGDISIARINQHRLLKSDSSDLVAKMLLDAARKGEFRKLLIDFSDVETASSSFLGSLVVLHQILKKQGRPMRIFGLNEALERVFEVAHLRDLFGIDAHEDTSRFEIERQ